MLTKQHKRLIFFIVAADIGALLAAGATSFGAVYRWLYQYHLYLSGNWPVSFEIWSIILLFVFGIIVGSSMVFAPTILPTLHTFLPSAKHSKHHHSATHFFAYAIAIIVECLLIGFLLGLMGKFLITQLFSFTASTGKTALVIFGFIGILFIVFGLGEFGYLAQLSWLTKLFHRTENYIKRFSGLTYHFFSGLLSAGGLGVGCPYPIFIAFFLLVAALGNIAFGMLAMLFFALGRLSPILLLIFLKIRRRNPEILIANITKISPKIRYLNGVVLTVIGSFLFVFWWIYASLSAFLYA